MSILLTLTRVLLAAALCICSLPMGLAAFIIYGFSSLLFSIGVDILKFAAWVAGIVLPTLE